MNVQDIRYVLQCADTVYHNGSSYDTKSGILAAAYLDVTLEGRSSYDLICVRSGSVKFFIFCHYI